MSTLFPSLSGVDIKSPKVFGGPLLLLLGLALLAIGAIVGINRSAEKRDVQDQIDSTRRSIDQLALLQQRAPEELQEEIDATRGRLRERLQSFPNSEEATAEISAYYTLAARHEANIVRLESLASSLALDPDAAVREETYLLEAQGAVRNLLRLLATITDAPFETFIFRDLTLNEDDPAWAEMRVTVLSTDLDWASWDAPAEEAPAEEAP
jgi:hypothetical protein